MISHVITMAAGPDGSGGKNAIQAIGSTVSYLERYTLLAATGLATEDQDDDGRGANPVPTMDKDRLKDHLSAIGMCSNLEILRTTYNTAYTEAKTLKDKDALMQIIDAMDVRKKKLLETEAA